jgi:hypothetical protein
MADWKLFRGTGDPHDDLIRLPPPPPWRFAGQAQKLTPPASLSTTEAARALPFIPSAGMVLAVNADYICAVHCY